MNNDQMLNSMTQLLTAYARKTQQAECVGCLFTLFMVRDSEPGMIRQELFGNGGGIDLAVAMVLTLGVLEERLSALGPEVRAKAEAEVRAMNCVHCDDWKPL